MPRRSRPGRLIQELQAWHDEELEELAAMITGLLESRQQKATNGLEEQREDGTPLGRHGGRGHMEMNVSAASGRSITSLRLTRFAARLRSTAPIRTAVPHAPQGAGN